MIGTLRPGLRTHALAGVVAVSGCFTVTEFGSASGTTSAGPSATTSLLPETTQTATSADTVSSSSSDATTGTTAVLDESSGDPSGCGFAGFICDVDAGPSPTECSLTEQDCPRGEKCTAWANDGGSAWNATKCVPVDATPDGPGESCTVTENGVSGIDSCDVGSMCWYVDGATLQGECVSFCTGPDSNLSCEQSGYFCRVGNLLALCLPPCDPLAAAPCPVGQACYPGGDLTVCAPDASGAKLGGAFDGCEFANACDPGLICANEEDVGACEQGDARCCTPWCDLEAPDCPEPTTCQPFFAKGTAEPGYESWGYCGQETSE